MPGAGLYLGEFVRRAVGWSLVSQNAGTCWPWGPVAFLRDLWPAGCCCGCVVGQEGASGLTLQRQQPCCQAGLVLSYTSRSSSSCMHTCRTSSPQSHPRFTAHHTAAPATPPAITPSSSTSPAAPSYTDSTRSSRRQRTALLPSWPTRRPPILPPPRAMVASDAAYPRVEMDIAEPVTPAGSTSGAPRKAKEEYIISKLADQDFDMSKHPLFLSSLSSSLPFPSLPSCTLRQAGPPSFVREYEGPTRR